MNVIIESAIKLDKDQQSQIEKTLGSKLSDAEFVYKVNPDILGGLRVTMGGKRIDLSLAGKVHQIEKTIS